MNHLSISPTNGNGPTQGQRKPLTRVGKAYDTVPHLRIVKMLETVKVGTCVEV